MKWLPARDVKFLLVFILISAVIIGVVEWYTSKVMKPENSASRDIQMEFYDLVSQHSENYNLNVKSENEKMLVTLTSLEDNQYLVQGQMTPTYQEYGKHYYAYTPVHYSKTTGRLMIDSIVDILMSMHVWIKPVSYNGQLLLIGQNGEIYIYSLK